MIFLLALIYLSSALFSSIQSNISWFFQFEVIKKIIFEQSAYAAFPGFFIDHSPLQLFFSHSENLFTRLKRMK